MASTLLSLGIVCVLAAIVGGGLKALGIELPVVRSLPRQLILAAFGVIVIVFSQLTSRTQQQQKAVATAEDVRALEGQIREDVLYDCAKLANWPNNVNGDEILKDLTALLQKAEEKDLGKTQSVVLANLYRCAGGAHLIATGELPDKLRTALPYLNRSLKFDPTQALLQQNIAALDAVLRNKGGETTVLFTNLLQVLRGNDPGIPALVEQLSSAANGTEYQARQWLLQQATSPPLWDFLEAVKLRIKKERGLDLPIEVTSSTVPNGLVDVQAKIGSNVFLWEVDYNAKKYMPKNQFTSDFMAHVVRPQQ